MEMMDNQIEQLKAQNKSPKYICLVGGFGSSKYVQQTLQEFYPSIKVVQSLRPHTAVVEGAVRALTNPSFIASRKARDHIGVLCEKPMNTRTAVRDELTGQKWAPYQVEPLVERGDDLSVMGEDTREKGFFEIVREKRQISTKYDIWFVISQRSCSPRSFSRNPIHDNPTGKEEWFCLWVDLTHYEKHFKLMNEGTAREHLRLDFKINVRYAGSSMVFHLKIDGKEVESLAKTYFTPDEEVTALPKSSGRLSKRACPEESPPLSRQQARRRKNLTTTRAPNPILDTIGTQDPDVSEQATDRNKLAGTNEQDRSSERSHSGESSPSGQQGGGQPRPSKSGTPLQKVLQGAVLETPNSVTQSSHT